jgi:hypothetical protein
MNDILKNHIPDSYWQQKVTPLEKPKKRRTLREVFSAIFDRRLYGPTFLIDSVPFLAVVFGVQVSIYIALNSVMLYVYVPLFVMLVFVSGFGTKNMSFRREVHSMGQFRVFLFSLASVMASLAPFTVNKPADPLQASAEFLLLYGISTLALTVAIVEITIYGQRISLRKSMELTVDFFKKQKKIWTEKLAGFPNSDNIVNCIDSAPAVTELFDHGSFGLALLWSCAVMEQTIDAVAEGVISREPARREIFRHKNNFRKAYLEQMENLGFCPDLSKSRDDEKITLKNLYSVRNDFAHRNVRPTFQQTFGAMATLKSFVEKMPEILQGLK